MLRRWVKEFSEHTKAAFPGNGTPRDEEVARLKRELAEVKRERDFLREAAAYFAKHPK
jgi:transposase